MPSQFFYLYSNNPWLAWKTKKELLLGMIRQFTLVITSGSLVYYVYLAIVVSSIKKKNLKDLDNKANSNQLTNTKPKALSNFLLKPVPVGFTKLFQAIYRHI